MTTENRIMHSRTDSSKRGAVWKRVKDMTEKTRNRNMIRDGGRLCFLFLITIVFPAVLVPILTATVEGKTPCPIPRKGSISMNQPKHNEALTSSALPPIDLITPARTEIATFSMG
jgi:hypothetical protein